MDTTEGIAGGHERRGFTACLRGDDATYASSNMWASKSVRDEPSAARRCSSRSRRVLPASLTSVAGTSVAMHPFLGTVQIVVAPPRGSDRIRLFTGVCVDGPTGQRRASAFDPSRLCRADNHPAARRYSRKKIQFLYFIRSFSLAGSFTRTHGPRERPPEVQSPAREKSHAA